LILEKGGFSILWVKEISVQEEEKFSKEVMAKQDRKGRKKPNHDAKNNFTE